MEIMMKVSSENYREYIKTVEMIRENNSLREENESLKNRIRALDMELSSMTGRRNILANNLEKAENVIREINRIS